MTYQLGNLASSASSTIEATIGERYPLPPSRTGVKRFDYGKVIGQSIPLLRPRCATKLTIVGILMGAVWAYILLFVFLGPEMSQEERNEEAILAQEYEAMRARGVSLLEIGTGRARMDEKAEKMGMTEDAEHVEKGAVGHIEVA